MTEQTSASDRYRAAHEALAAFDSAERGDEATAETVAFTLRALVTPPSVGESVEQIVDRILAQWRRDHDYAIDLEEAMVRAVSAGIQSAHEAWEPEVALRPTQEQMLRWLGIRYGAAGRPTHIHIPFQNIEREDA